MYFSRYFSGYSIVFCYYFSEVYKLFKSIETIIAMLTCVGNNINVQPSLIIELSTTCWGILTFVFGPNLILDSSGCDYRINLQFTLKCNKIVLINVPFHKEKPL